MSEVIPSTADVFNLDFALEQEWIRSFKRMRRTIGASEDNSVDPSIYNADDDLGEDAALGRDRDWQIAKVQESIRKTRDMAIVKELRKDIERLQKI